MKSLKTSALLILLILVTGCGDEEDKKASPLDNSPTLNDARVEAYDVLEAAAMQSRSNVGNDGLVSITDSDITFKSPSEICSQLSSATQSVDDGLERRPSPISPLRRHMLREWLLFEYSGSNTSAARVVLSQHREVPGDYLTAGHWMCLEGDLDTKSVANAEVGAFVDAPELAGTPQLPAEGTFLYTGYATGMYLTYYGPGREIFGPPFFEGLKEGGDFSGPISFQVDFTNGVVEACLGCVENMEFTAIQLDPEGNQAPFYNFGTTHSMAFSPIQLQQDGTFQGKNLKSPIADSFIGDIPLRSLLPYVVENDSTWGGRFSSLPAADDDTGAPRLVAGTFRFSQVLSDESRDTAFGNFFATKVRTQ